jgi:hypothetical protein
MFETCRRQEELNYNFNLKSAFCWLTLLICVTMHGTKKNKDEWFHSFSVDQNLGFFPPIGYFKYNMELNGPLAFEFAFNTELVKFYILVTVHLGIILINNQLDAQHFCIYLFRFSTCFEQLCTHHQESQLYQYNARITELKL